jgi:dihydroflavonol-4-reductase
MKVFLTGASGFIGGHVARKLRERGDQVVALVRNPGNSPELAELGVDVRQGDLSSREKLSDEMRGCDQVIHGAAIYEVGVPKRRRPELYEANVTGTENALGAALDARIPRVVYVSTVAVFGNTHGEVVDETFEHPGASFTSYYEQTKHEAHQVAKRLIAEGLPCVIVQPGGVYGPQDHSAIGKQISDFVAGRMPAVAFPELGFSLVHVEDVADGILLALDKGEEGSSYVIGGEITTMRGMIETAAEVTGKKAPKRNMPTGMLKALTPAGPVVGKVMGLPPNLRELISSSDGVTFFASSEKAKSKLGYRPRPLEQGLRETLAAEGKL